MMRDVGIRERGVQLLDDADALILVTPPLVCSPSRRNHNAGTARDVGSRVPRETEQRL